MAELEFPLARQAAISSPTSPTEFSFHGMAISYDPQLTSGDDQKDSNVGFDSFWTQGTLTQLCLLTIWAEDIFDCVGIRASRSRPPLISSASRGAQITLRALQGPREKVQ